MTEIIPRKAGLISAVLAIVLILIAYLLFATVDVSFVSEDHEVYRLENVNVFSDLSIPDSYDQTFIYDTGSLQLEFGDTIDFRFEIVKTAFLNLINFKWDEADNLMTVVAQ